MNQVLNWLLEPNTPSARYLALRHLGRAEDDDQVVAARTAVATSAPARAILDAQYPAGYWIKPDRGYSPRYKATIWQLIFLADLGAMRTAAIARACEHVLAHTLHAGCSLFSAHAHSTGIYPCLNGNLLRALRHFGYGGHPTVRLVTESLARRVAADGFTCPRNGTRVQDRATWQPCVWGCVKVLRGLATVPDKERSPAVRMAVERGTAFLLARDLARDQRPRLAETGSHWLRFGFPLGYDSDLLEALLALAELGVKGKLDDAVRIVHAKQDGTGRWRLERALPKTWADFGTTGQPNKWVTLRALQVLEAVELSTPFITFPQAGCGTCG
jgi:hypothetical protein